MLRIKQLALLCFPFMIMVSPLSGQQIDDLEINAEFQDKTLQVILDDLSKKYSFIVYYPVEALPQELLSFTFDAVPLSLVLSRLLANTSFDYISYRSYLIVIGEKDQISRDYSVDYFKAVEEMLNATPEKRVEGEPVFEVGKADQISLDGQATITGIITDAEDAETIIGAAISFPQIKSGTTSGIDGRFTIELPIGTQKVIISYLGYKTLSASIHVFNDGNIEIAIEKMNVLLEEVVVEAEAPDANIESATIGMTRLKMEEIRKLPTFLGEVDVIRSLLQQPGVTNAGEGAGGFNVRGGGVDQNLILLDEHFVFNTSHALGFFSAFNPDIINRVTLYKGYMPAHFGGRLSSVLEVEMKDGGRDRFRMKGGIGLVSARISAEGPVIKDKSSFLAGFRTTYSNWLLRIFNVPELRNSNASFYDANLRYTHRFNENNQLVFSFYSSQDKVGFNQQFGFDYHTLGGQLTYKKVFNPKLISSLSLVASLYQATGTETRDSLTASGLFTQYRYYKVKEVLTYFPTDQLEIRAGISGVFYNISPGQKTALYEVSTVLPITLEDEQALEAALFADAQWSISSRFMVSAGLRLVGYNYLGPKTYFTYENPEFPTNGSITGVNIVASGKSIARYQSLEPRLATRYLLSARNSLKFGYSRTAQFINQFTNLITPSPLSIWQLSNQYIKPQRAHNLSMGYFRNFKENIWETSVEAYYRYIDQLTDFKDFAQLAANPNIETELIAGTGQAYGLELSIKKKTGKVNGWMSYTYSRALQKVEGINNNQPYPAYYDKPHDLTLVTNWQLTGRINVAFNFNYSTGRPITAPVAQYTTGGGQSILEYSGRNQVRIPDYHRLDLAVTLDQSYKRTKRLKHNWTLSVYNLYGRKNAYSVFFEPTGGLPNIIRLSVLGSAFVSLTINFVFL